LVNTKPNKGFKVGTFIENTIHSPKNFFHQSYYWAHQCGTVLDQEFETGVSHLSIVQWNQWYRGVCAVHFEAHPQRIGGGGTGVVVEIDETYVSKRKYGVGRRKCFYASGVRFLVSSLKITLKGSLSEKFFNFFTSLEPSDLNSPDLFCYSCIIFISI
jgi:hypothetical protein